MNKFQRSWALMKSSLSVIGQNKKLLIFPIVISICTVTIVLFFAAPAVLRPTGHSYFSADHWQAISHSLFQNSDSNARGRVTLTPGAAAYVAFLYLISMFVATFCNVAFYHEILAALTRQPVSIARGLRFAASRLGSILLWTLFAGLIGLLIKAIEEKFSLVGRIIGKLIGIAWSVAAVFAIPVIVRESQNANPVAVLRKSATVLKRTWGEALIGYAGLSFANGIIVILSLLWLFGAVGASLALHNFFIAGFAIFGWVVAMFAWGYLTGVASQVYRGALYLYAAEGTLVEPYNQEMLDMAWKYKKS
jgi:Family of unknown function (DUF6159)